MDAMMLILKGALAIAFGGLLMLVASFILGYLFIGKLLNPDIRLRWLVLVVTFLVLSLISCNPNWLAGLSTRDFQQLRFELILRSIPIGISLGQMFGGSRVKIEKRKGKGEEEDEEEE